MYHKQECIPVHPVDEDVSKIKQVEMRKNMFESQSHPSSLSSSSVAEAQEIGSEQGMKEPQDHAANKSNFSTEKTKSKDYEIQGKGDEIVESMSCLETVFDSKQSLSSNSEKKQKKRLEKQERTRDIQEKLRLYGSFGILAESSSSQGQDKIRKRIHSSIGSTTLSKEKKSSTLYTPKQPKRKVVKGTDMIACSKNFVTHTLVEILPLHFLTQEHRLLFYLQFFVVLIIVGWRSVVGRQTVTRKMSWVL